MGYNLTNVTESVDFAGVYGGINNLTNGLLSSFVLFSLFVIVFISFKDKYETKMVLLASSFFVTLVGGGFWAAGFVSLEVILIPSGLLVASIIMFLMD